MLPRSAVVEIGRDASLLAATALAAHGIGLARYGAGPRATSLAFSTLTTGQLLHALSYRSRRRWGEAPLLFGTVGLSVLAQMGAMVLPPLRNMLGLTRLGAADWGLVLGGAAVPLLVSEMARRGRAVDHVNAGLPARRRTPWL
jgi:Ca2+-transporting ATPase